MEPDENGKISKQAWMKFMGEEFDRLDKDKNGELDAQELHRLNAPIKHAFRTIGSDRNRNSANPRSLAPASRG
jgi:hypothetical protein